MAKTSTKPVRRLNREDPDEHAWRDSYAIAEAANRSAMEHFEADVAAARKQVRKGRTVKVALPILVKAPALPDWHARRPAHVTRDLLGRFLHDRDTNVVHDCYAAAKACEIDRIRNGTFVHFGGELEAALPADVVECSCMSQEA